LPPSSPSNECLQALTIGAKMLPTFRILLATTVLAGLAVAAATRGLIATPEVRTRIGEVPTIGRPLIQMA
jgi:hypothetical protein